MILKLDRTEEESLLHQICSQIRGQILGGTLPLDYRLPSTRRMNVDYGVSRNIFLEAYEQLIAEGFLEARKGRGTFVSCDVSPLQEEDQRDHPPSPPVLGPAGRKVHFAVGTPDPALFPLKEWGAALRQAVLTYKADEMGYSSAGGYAPLREELQTHLLKNKGMRIRKEQIFVCAGSYQALMLGMKSIRDHRDDPRGLTVIENPAFFALTEGLAHMGVPLRPVETDSRGLDPGHLEKLSGLAALCITPSHLFPLGTVYPMDRRIRLSCMASEKDFYILENDYEGDFRLKGAPTPSLYGLNKEKVLHAGTLSQILYPGLRVGYLVVPEGLVGYTQKALAHLGYQVPMAIQKALAAFMRKGELNRHFRKMKCLYQRRQQYFVSALKKAFGDRLTLFGEDTGLYLSARIEGYLFNEELRQHLEEAGIQADYEYLHYWPGGSRKEAPGILLGYASLSEEEIDRGIRLLAGALESFRPKSREKGKKPI